MKNQLQLLLILLSSSIYGQGNTSTIVQSLGADMKKTLICGHRGGYYLSYPENSISIMDYIVQSEPSVPIMFELDIRRDMNGKLWIMHDPTLERTTNGHGIMAHSPSSVISSLQLKNQSGKLTSEGIPSFDKVLSYIEKKPIFLMLDIKEDIYDLVLKIINDYDLSSRCIILTFTTGSTYKAYNDDSKALISTLVNSSEDLDQVHLLNIPKERLVAYVTKQTPKTAITQLKNNGTITLSDSRELWNNLSSPLQVNYYDSLIHAMELNILVTDFPIEVETMLSRQK